VTDPQFVDAAFQSSEPDAVINLAARAGVPQSVAMPAIYFATNVNGLLNVLEACRRHGVSKVVQASTSSVYGDTDIPFREDHPADRPLSPYAASKRASEMLAHSFHHLHGLDVTVLRFFTVYGPAGRPEMSLFRFIRWIAQGTPVKLIGDGEQSRDFTYVDDIAAGVVASLRPLGFEIINLGGDQPEKMNHVIRLIEDLVGRRAVIDWQPWHPSDVRATWADISRARRLLEWEPQVPLIDGIRQTVEWYRSHRDLVDSLDLGDGVPASHARVL
jgi:nucleoside-diphosphate-sugar epimerase